MFPTYATLHLPPPFSYCIAHVCGFFYRKILIVNQQTLHYLQNIYIYVHLTTSCIYKHYCVTHACGIIFNLLHCITMHFIYQINRLTTTKADSTYLDTIPCHTMPCHAIPYHSLFLSTHAMCQRYYVHDCNFMSSVLHHVLWVRDLDAL